MIPTAGYSSIGTSDSVCNEAPVPERRTFGRFQKCIFHTGISDAIPVPDSTLMVRYVDT